MRGITTTYNIGLLAGLRHAAELLHCNAVDRDSRAHVAHCAACRVGSVLGREVHELQTIVVSSLGSAINQGVL